MNTKPEPSAVNAELLKTNATLRSLVGRLVVALEGLMTSQGHRLPDEKRSALNSLLFEAKGG